MTSDLQRYPFQEPGTRLQLPGTQTWFQVLSTVSQEKQVTMYTPNNTENFP